MIGRMSLGYLVFEVSALHRWRRFAEDIMGCTPAPATGGEAAGFRVDAAAYRLLLRRGKANDIAVIGWEMNDRDALDALAQRLRVADVAVEAFSAADLAARQVSAGLRFVDPRGTVNEAVLGLRRLDEPFRSPLMPEGFTTGALGIGHAVLAAGKDLAALERFYTEIMGLRLTERLDAKVGPVRIEGAFLHCNRRHHSLALIAAPSRKRLLHFMLQANRLRDVGVAFERAKAAGVPISLDLGQHPDPDGTISFYGATPSGFDFEIGAESGLIDIEGWRPGALSNTSAWGHKPSLRLKLRAARDLVAERLGL